MSQIINQSRVYEGIIVGYIPAKEKTDRFGHQFTTNPVAFIYPNMVVGNIPAIIETLE